MIEGLKRFFLRRTGISDVADRCLTHISVECSQFKVNVDIPGYGPQILHLAPQRSSWRDI